MPALAGCSATEGGPDPDQSGTLDEPGAEVEDGAGRFQESLEDIGDLPVVARIRGHYDGEQFHFDVLGSDTTETPEGLGVIRQAALTPVDADSFGTGVDGTGIDIVALEQQERTERPGTGPWPSTVCGVEPAIGVCARIRARNLFEAFDLTRTYVRLTSLAPGEGTLSVTVAQPGPDVETATPEFGASGTGGGLWRYGHLHFLSPLDNGPERWWLFYGTLAAGSTRLRFNFTAEVLAAPQQPTIRANARDGTLDSAPYYQAKAPAASVGNSGVDVSADGRYVVFASSDTTLHPDAATAGSGTRVFRKDLVTNATVVVSRAMDGSVPSGCTSDTPTVSTNGRYVAFRSTCVMSPSITYPQASQVYIRDIDGGATYLASRSSESALVAANSAAEYPRISGNGQFVVYQTSAGNLVPPGARPAGRGAVDIYRYSLADDAVVRANVPNGLNANDPSVAWPNALQRFPDISDDGSLVVFQTWASNLVTPDPFQNTEIYLYDIGASLSTGTSQMSRISTTSSGAQMGKESDCELATISGDGSSVAFHCIVAPGEPALVASPPTTAGRRHVYVRDSAPGAASSIRMIDVSPDGTTEADTSSKVFAPYFDATGRLVAYSSPASNLVRSAGCSPACITPPAGVAQLYVFDRFASDPELRRSFAVSLIRRKDPGGLPNAALLTSSLTGPFAIGGSVDNAFAFYTASSGGDWSQLLAASVRLFASPIGDPLFE